MLQQEINIVSFNVPYPPNYGGAIDVFYKIATLSKLGVKIHLHCFKYGRNEAKELMKYCATVNYYERKLRLIDFFSTIPFIVQSRNKPELLKNLTTNKFPILFEGLHSCYFLKSNALKSRFKIVRTHNIEHDYYFAIAKQEQNIFKRIYFYAEAYKLKAFEKKLACADELLSISENDFIYFSGKYKNTINIPAFHNSMEMENITGRGKYILFHADISVVENEKVLLFLFENVFTKTSKKVIIAGRNPSKKIIKLSEKTKNTVLFKNPSNTEMNQLIKEAQIIILYTFQATGLKLKLLNSLYRGRFCIANNKMFAGTSLAQCCVVANSTNEIITAINNCFTIDFSTEEIEKRRLILQEKYSNEKNGQKLIDILRYKKVCRTL